jgi:hypothetical protein
MPTAASLGTIASPCPSSELRVSRLHGDDGMDSRCLDHRAGAFDGALVREGGHAFLAAL